jgi:DNA-binding transcriptional LysR family regulator
VISVEVRHLRNFLAVAEELNFTRAAERLHLAQQALSRSIRQLELLVGAELFFRNTRTVELTEAGEILVPLAREAVNAVDVAAEAVRDLTRGLTGRLRVGLAATGGIAITPTLLRTFAARNPGVEMEVRHFDFSGPTGGIAEGVTDVAIVRPPFATAVEQLVIGTERRFVVLPADHRLGGCDSVPFHQLLEEPWMTADTDATWCAFWRGDAHRREPAPAGAECMSFDELFEAARAHRAIGMVPESAVRSSAWPGLSFVPIEDVEPSLVVVAWRTDEQRALVRKFVNVAAEIRPTSLNDSVEEPAAVG